MCEENCKSRSSRTSFSNSISELQFQFNIRAAAATATGAATLAATGAATWAACKPISYKWPGLTMKADPGKGHVCCLCVRMCVCCVAFKAIYGQYFCLATGRHCMTNTAELPLHFIMANKISNCNRSGDTQQIHIKANKCQLQLPLATKPSCCCCCWCCHLARPGLPCQFMKHLSRATLGACSKSHSAATAQRLKPKPTMGLSIHKYLQLLLLLPVAGCPWQSFAMFKRPRPLH